jgi:hypothetical protein
MGSRSSLEMVSEAFSRSEHTSGAPGCLTPKAGWMVLFVESAAARLILANMLAAAKIIRVRFPV